MSDRLKTVACTAFVLAVVLVAGWPWWKHHLAVSAVRSERQAARDDQRRQWDTCPTVPIRDPAREPDELSAIAALIEDPASRLTSPMRAGFGAALGAQLAARSSASPDEYVRLARSEPTKWIEPQNDRAWHVLEYWWEKNLNGRPDRADASGALRAFVSEQFGPMKARLVARGSGPKGCRIIAFRIRTPGAITYGADAALADDAEYWLAPSHNAIVFRTPVPTLEQVISRDGEAVCIEVNMIVTVERGYRYNWNSRWYYDPATARWLVHSMARRGWWAYAMYY